MNYLNISTKPQRAPLIITPNAGQSNHIEDLINEIAQNQTQLHELLNTYGAICFRGFVHVSVKQFQSLITSAQLGEYFDYDFGLRPNIKAAEGVVFSPFSSPNSFITPHSEKTHSQHYPDYISFYSKCAAISGGQTPLTDNLAVWANLDEKLKDKFENQDILYKWHFFGFNSLSYQFFRRFIKAIDAHSWMRHFKTLKPAKVEQILAKEGFDYSWHTPAGNLSATAILPATRVHPQTQQTLWFNHVSHMNNHSHFYRDIIDKFYKPLSRLLLRQLRYLTCTAFWQDGRPFSKQEVDHIHQAINRATVPFTWQNDDLMIVDNLRFMHSKTPHRGQRELLISLTKRP